MRALIVLLSLIAGLLIVSAPIVTKSIPQPSGDFTGKHRPVEFEAAELTGRFVYNGPAPIAARFNDKAFGIIVDESLLVGPDGGIANVLVFVRTATVPITSDAEKTVVPLVQFATQGARFQPRILALWFAKQNVVLKNSDQIHLYFVNYQPLRERPFNQALLPGQEFVYTHTTKQSLPYYVNCNLHPWMKGYLFARDNPYFAVSGPDGKFNIKHLPAGMELEFQLWHERAGYLCAKPLWAKGRFKLSLQEGLNDLGQIDVDPAMFP